MLGRLCYEEMTKFGGPHKGGYFEVSVGLLLLLLLLLLRGGARDDT